MVKIIIFKIKIKNKKLSYNKKNKSSLVDRVFCDLE